MRRLVTLINEWLHNKDNRLTLYCILAVTVTCALMYVPTLEFPFLWDDKEILFRNVHISSMDNISRAFTGHYLNIVNDEKLVSPYYRPVSLAVLFIERNLFGASPVGYHLFHMFVHMCTALLLFWVARFAISKYGAQSRPKSTVGALFTSLCFLMLPYTVDAVLFLTNLGDLLVGCSLLISLCLFNRVLNGSKIAVAGLVLSSLVAVGSKETGLAVPIILCFYTFLNPERPPLKRAFIGIGASVFSAMTYLVARYFILTAANKVNVENAFIRLFSDYAMALRWAILPHPLALEEPGTKTFFDLWWFLGLGFVIAVAAAILLLRKRLPAVPLLILSWAALVGPSLISIQHTLIFSLRYLYVPGLAIAIGLGFLFARSSKTLRFGLAGCTVGLLLLAIIRIHSWSSEVAFWTLETTRHPESASALVNLGAAVEKKQNYQGALDIYSKAIKAAVKEKDRKIVSYTTYRRGFLYDAVFGRKDIALNHYLTAAEAYPTADIWIAVGNLYAFHRKWDEALEASEKAAKLEENNYDVQVALAGALGGLGRFDEALVHVDKAMELAGNSKRKLAEMEQRKQAMISFKNRKHFNAQ